MKKIVYADGTVEWNGTPEELAGLDAEKPKPAEFGGFSRQDDLHPPDPEKDGPIVDPSEPLVVGG